MLSRGVAKREGRHSKKQGTSIPNKVLQELMLGKPQVTIDKSMLHPMATKIPFGRREAVGQLIYVLYEFDDVYKLVKGEIKGYDEVANEHSVHFFDDESDDRFAMEEQEIVLWYHNNPDGPIITGKGSKWPEDSIAPSSGNAEVSDNAAEEKKTDSTGKKDEIVQIDEKLMKVEDGVVEPCQTKENHAAIKEEGRESTAVAEQKATIEDTNRGKPISTEIAGSLRVDSKNSKLEKIETKDNLRGVGKENVVRRRTHDATLPSPLQGTAVSIQPTTDQATEEKINFELTNQPNNDTMNIGSNEETSSKPSEYKENGGMKSKSVDVERNTKRGRDGSANENENQNMESLRDGLHTEDNQSKSKKMKHSRFQVHEANVRKESAVGYTSPSKYGKNISTAVSPRGESKLAKAALDISRALHMLMDAAKNMSEEVKRLESQTKSATTPEALRKILDKSSWESVIHSRQSLTKENSPLQVISNHVGGSLAGMTDMIFEPINQMIELETKWRALGKQRKEPFLCRIPLFQSWKKTKSDQQTDEGTMKSKEDLRSRASSATLKTPIPKEQPKKESIPVFFETTGNNSRDKVICTLAQALAVSRPPFEAAMAMEAGLFNRLCQRINLKNRNNSAIDSIYLEEAMSLWKSLSPKVSSCMAQLL